MKHLIIDASIAAKWFLPEADSVIAEKLIEAEDELSAPLFLETEFANIFWKHSVAQRTSLEVWRLARVQLRRLITHWHADEDLHDRALELAVQHNHPVYDCIYLALAIQTDGAVVTVDKRFLALFGKSIHASRVVSLQDAVAHT